VARPEGRRAWLGPRAARHAHHGVGHPERMGGAGLLDDHDPPRPSDASWDEFQRFRDRFRDEYEDDAGGES
jgi:hypothetical protein